MEDNNLLSKYPSGIRGKFSYQTALTLLSREVKKKKLKTHAYIFGHLESIRNYRQENINSAKISNGLNHILKAQGKLLE